MTAAYEYNEEKKSLISDSILTISRIGKGTSSVSVFSQKITPSLKDLDTIFKAEKEIYAGGNKVLHNGISQDIYAHDYISTQLIIFNTQKNSIDNSSSDYNLFLKNILSFTIKFGCFT